MTVNGWVQIALYCVLLTLLVKPFGGYLTRVFNGERTLLYPVLHPLEVALYRICGVREDEEQHWVTYAVAMLLFSVAGFLSLYALQRLQAMLPFNPQGQSAVGTDLAFNTAVSFITNTNWQSYTPESTMSYLVQMAGLTVHNFLSAATGIALAVALIRGFARRSSATLGNFWVDLTRCTLYILLPVSIVVGLFFVSQGMPQNLHAYTEATTLEGAKQVIAQGPVASQEVIKMFGTNGGGFFNANSAHPFENPNALTNFVQILLIFSIGAGLTNVFGRMVGNQRQGWAIFAIMGVLFLAGVFVTYPVEAGGNPAFAAMHVDSAASALQAGGNMEGKEVRFGIANSALFTTITTDASCGAVNNMHDSLLPLAGMVPMVNIMLGEIIFGGVGSGLYGMLAFAIVAVFVAGLMVGRTPEYLGKKIEAKEVKMSMLAILILPLSILGFTRTRRGAAWRHGCDGECRAARVQRGALRLHLSDRQQRQRVRRTVRQRSILECHAGLRHADRPLPVRDPAAGRRGIARVQEDRAGLRRNVPDRWRPVRGPGCRSDPDRRRPHFLPRTVARPRGRTSRDERRHDILIRKSGTQDGRLQHPSRRRFRDARSRDPGPCPGRHDPQARSAADGAQSGHVRGRGRRDADDRHLDPRPRERRRRPQLHAPDRVLAMAHRAVRQLRRSSRGGARQGAGGGAAQDPHGNPRRSGCAGKAGTGRKSPLPPCAWATKCWWRRAT